MACVCYDLGCHAILIGSANSLLYLWCKHIYKDDTHFLTPRSPYVLVCVCVWVGVCVCVCVWVGVCVCE